MRTHPVLVMMVTVILCGSLATEVYAKPDRRERAEQSERDDHRDRDKHKESRKGVLGRDEAARRAQRQHGGKVLSVDLLQSEDAPARYRVKLFSNGNVRTIDVDALEE